MAVVVSSWTGSLPSTKAQLREKVCNLYGYDGGEQDLAAKALQWLDESVVDLNMNVWESMRVVEQGIPLVAGQGWVLLTSQVFKESQVYLVHNTDGDQKPLPVLPWVPFKRLYSATNLDGTPQVCSIFNGERDGRLYFDRLPEAGDVSDYTLAVEYYQRLPKISTLGDSDSPEIPAEFENVLLYGAYKRAAMYFGNAQDVGNYAMLEREALERLKRIDSMQPDSDRRFRLGDDGFDFRRMSNYIYPY